LEALKAPEQPAPSGRGQIWLRRIGWFGIGHAYDKRRARFIY
jgi:hypothetical protein